MAQSQEDLNAAFGKYFLGKTNDAISDLERLLNSLNYESDKVRFIQTARSLINLYWRVEDPVGIQSVIHRAEEVLKNRQPLDDVDRVLVAFLGSYRIRELLLLRDLATARELGVQWLDILAPLAAAPYRAARLELLLTLAIISRSEFRLSEAESYMHQAIGLALGDDQIYGFSALEFLDWLLRHYMESGQYQYATLVAQRLLKAPAAFRSISDQSIHGFSLFLSFAELGLQTATIESSEPVLELLLGLERIEGTLQGLPRRLKFALYAMLLYLRLERHEFDGATRAFSTLEALYKADESNVRGVANILAWAAHRLGAREAAIHYVSAGRSEANEINVYLYPLNRLVAAALDRDAGRLVDAARNAQESLWALLKNIAARGFAAPTAAINLSFVERTIVVDFVRLSLELPSSGDRGPVFSELLSLGVQLLQRDQIPRGALFAPGLLVAPTANVEEHLRAREHLAQARYLAVLNAVDLLVERAAMMSGTPSKVYDFGEMNRLFEYTLRVNSIDTYLQSLLYTQKDFITARLALVSPQDLQRVLGPNEALVSHVAIPPDVLFIECLTHDAVQFFSAHFDPKSFLSDVRLLNLSVSATHGPSRSLDSQYPAASAVAIFQTLFGPASTCLRNKTQLILATDPALLGVPFNALLTAMPFTSGKGYDLKRAPWMIREWALSVSLARSTLLSQRSRPSLARPRKSMIGFGNPRFGGSANVTRFVDPHSVYDARGGVRIEALRGLPALPDTEAELRGIKSSLGASDGVLFLGEDATERSVRSQDLDDYKVVVFATHALTAGEFDSLTEPALALTPGDIQDTRNDGLLRMSEISRLWIAADLVVLSACNTAAGDGTPSAVGFSGLVNAFFFAGARAVLASQWPVASQMAETLTTGMFAAAATEPGLAPSVALQRAMLRIINESAEPAYAHPRFWAPFVVAGDGASSAGVTAPSTPTKPQLSTRWERNLGEKLAGEILSVSADGDGTVYAMGYTEPKNGRAKSIVLAVDDSGTERWRVEDPVIAAGSHLLQYARNRIAVAGYLWSQERHGGVVLRGLDSRNGTELWRTVIDTPEEDYTLGLLPVADDRILWVIGSNADATEGKDPRLTITLVTLDFSGAIVTTRSREIRGEAFRSFSGAAVARWQGHLLLGWIASKSVANTLEIFGKESRDPPSGYGTACATKRFTEFILIDELTGRIVTEKTINDLHLKSFALAMDGRLLASAEVWDKCLGKSDAAVVEVAADLAVTTMFRYGGPLEKRVGQIAILPDAKIVLVGQIGVVFDLDPYVKLNLSDVRPYLPVFTGEFFQNDRRTLSAFVVLLDSDGTFLADRVIRDLRGRVLRVAIARNDGSMVFGGLANGVSSWLGVIDTK